MTDVGTLVALDPSVVSSGVAIFVDGQLAACARVRAPETSAAEAVRCAVMAKLICDWIEPHVVSALAFERPVIYPPPKGKGDPNKLMMMWGVDLAVLTNVAMRCGSVQVYEYEPNEWAGNVPKTIERAGNVRTLPRKGEHWQSPRGARVLSRLSPAELAVASADASTNHDVVDAIGIGLQALGRLGIRRALATR